MRIAEIGDNCIDLYERIGKKYPTGNVVDTGVNLKKLGADVSIISTTGSDEYGQWMNVDGEVYFLIPHPDMIEEVEVIYGYTDGDLITVTCDIEVQGDYKTAKVWSSK